MKRKEPIMSDKLADLYAEIEQCNSDLKSIETMTNKEVCETYFVDNKGEAIKLIDEELASLNSDLLTEIERLESWD